MLPTTLPIARLRGLGCSVGHVVGHDPKHGRWQYRVTLPNGVDSRSIAAGCGHGVTVSRPDQRVLLVQQFAPQRGSAVGTMAAGRRAADALSAIADRLQGG